MTARRTLAHTLLVQRALQLDPPLRVTHARPSGNRGDFKPFGFSFRDFSESNSQLLLVSLEVPLGKGPPEGSTHGGLKGYLLNQPVPLVAPASNVPSILVSL